MPKVQLTIDQLQDAVGIPVIVLIAMDQTTQTVMTLRLADLGVAAVAAAVAWMNARLSTP
jgi:2-methylisocitrate lyase-like PEP mutase family enzyme